MRDERFWKWMAVCALVVMMYVGHGLHTNSEVIGPALVKSVQASGVGTPNDATEIVLTSSQDGQKVYMWQYNSSRPPRFLGMSQTKN